MLNLEKIWKIWKDLDTSYRTLSKPGQSKKDYLDTLIGYNRKTGVNGLDYLEGKLLEEYESYNDEQNTIYRKLLEIFGVLRDTYETFTGEIDSLDGFINNHLMYAKSGATMLNNGFISKMQLKYVPNKRIAEVMDLAAIYEFTGQLGSCTIKKDYSYVTVEMEDPDAFLYDGTTPYTRLVLNDNYDSPIRLDVAWFISTYLHSTGKESIDEPFLFLREKYYNVSGERIYVTIGNSKKYVQMKTVEETDDYYLFTKVYDKIKYNIVCFK